MTRSVEEYQRWYQRAHQAPGNPDAHFNHAWWATRLGRFTEAIEAYERALRLPIKNPEEALTNLAGIYSERLGLAGEAKICLSRALERNPDYYPAVFNRAHLAEQLGDREAALAGFARALELDPGAALPLARLTEALEIVRDDDPRVRLLRGRATDTADPDLLFALAKVEERLGHFADAWSAMASANGADRERQPPWPSGKFLELSRGQLERPIPPLAGAGGPVFIVGMFRTGSTLLEQILAAHSRFVPLGESEFWPRAIAAGGGGMLLPARPLAAEGAQALAGGFARHLEERGVTGSVRVTDKRPDNLYHIPLIATVLPAARFVITDRDWRDTLLSVFGTRLHPQHGYATSVTGIREQLALCDELAEAWTSRYPERVYRLSYEALVTAPEETLSGLLAWLGEPWEPDCLSFHNLSNAVRTASVWQVREPLNGNRRGRWRRFEAPLREVLGSALDQSSPRS